MNNCILLGKPNVGKTTFFLSYAEYLGVTSCILEFENFEGSVTRKNYSINVARSYLINQTPFKTKEICRMNLSIPVYKGRTEITLFDTGGLIDGISANEIVRKSMAEALKQLYLADLILHMIDASSVDHNCCSTLSEIDYQINQYGHSRGAYCILANKIDLEEGEKGLSFIRKEFKDTYIIPISARKMKGFKEVNKFVSRVIQ
ncbi:small GTP-binding protein domain-containing protein [Natronincola peptidivorans]|uniref:Small GTP-binding protein domain-containing protein n=1 Tax=Natronincola peptidivorans TaxID=426128 RepID=A0A1H9YLH1_9FIRM|nr:GTPase domain-containing protein [Natronincola peptidivorans]SES69798.1 small GTP-binding protein domain-containing protein [Natronincola peptidivorans]